MPKAKTSGRGGGCGFERGSRGVGGLALEMRCRDLGLGGGGGCGLLCRCRYRGFGRRVVWVVVLGGGLVGIVGRVGLWF